MSLYIDTKMIRSFCHRPLDLTKQLQCRSCVLGIFPTRTRLVLRQFRPIYEIQDISRTTQQVASRLLLTVDVQWILPRQSTESE